MIITRMLPRTEDEQRKIYPNNGVINIGMVLETHTSLGGVRVWTPTHCALCQQVDGRRNNYRVKGNRGYSRNHNTPYILNN